MPQDPREFARVAALVMDEGNVDPAFTACFAKLLVATPIILVSHLANGFCSTSLVGSIDDRPEDVVEGPVGSDGGGVRTFSRIAPSRSSLFRARVTRL